MTTNDLVTNSQKVNMLLKTFLCLTYILFINLAGCQSDFGTATDHQLHPATQATQELYPNPSIGLNNMLRAEGIAAKRTEQLRQASASLPIENEQTSPVLSTAPEAPSKEPLTTTKTSAPTQKQTSPQATTKLPVLDKPSMADQLVSINFDQVDIRVVLKTIGEITGVNFVVDDKVNGSVTVMSPTKIPLREIYGVLESILEVKGYAAVPAGDLVKIIPRAEATKHNLQVRVGNNPSEILRSDSILTQIIPLRHADAKEVSHIIKPLLSTGAYMATYPRTNSILITDTSSSIHHVAKIIQEFDVVSSEEQVTVVGLEHASAQVLSEQITRIMEKSKLGSSKIKRGPKVPQTDTETKILPDLRTNSLIIVANARDTYAIKRLIIDLDVQRPSQSHNVHVVYLKNAQAKDVAESLAGAVANLSIAGALESAQNVQVTADEGTNALIITASAQDYEVIAQIVEKLDIVREQVLVEMLIMEVSEDSLKEIGIDWATLDEAVAGSVRFFGATNFGPRVDFANGDLEGLAVGSWKGLGSNVRIGTILHALEKTSGVNILSTPHILTSNHNKAKIIVGENIPFVVESRITETTDFITPTVIDTFDYKDVGISLEITPHISQNGLVRLEVDSEFTKLIEGVTGTSVNTPTTAKRQAQTVVSMNSGSTIVIGGLIRDDKVSIEKKIPLVGDLPLVGGLFRFQRDRLQKTNLLIFITPYVMSSQADLDQITEQKKKEVEPALDELGKTEDSSNSSMALNRPEGDQKSVQK
ncbi:MAG: type II secretion system secretin GspD [Sedimentisphaerales bacterium]|nr:type II secretion system secretin GspD [Sedimentisphaerales bacterium]